MPNESGLAANLAEALLPYLEGKLKSKVDSAELEAILERLTIVEQNKATTIRIETDTETREVSGLVHKLMPTALAYLVRNRNVWLYGGAGGGKTKAAEQLAEALGLVNFCPISLNPATQPSFILGFISAHGDYIRTTFRDAWEHGGLIFLDEVCNASGNFLTTLNAALEHQYLAFPDGLIQRHESTRFIVADNTCGLGATAQYNVRQKMDAAFRQRFVFINWSYDEALELAVASAYHPQAPAIVAWVLKARAAVETLKLQLIVSPRESLMISDALHTDLPLADIIDSVVFKGVDSDTRAKVLASAPLPQISGR
jgi:cobaltochelatase CobS